MLTKAMRIGSKRTSIKLERKFWMCLKEIADRRNVTLTTIVNEVVSAEHDGTNVASTLRTFALGQLAKRVEMLQNQSTNNATNNQTSMLMDLIKCCPMPSMVIDINRCIIISNSAFASWIQVAEERLYGQRIDHIMTLGGKHLPDLWAKISNGQLQHATCEATLVSLDGMLRTQAIIVALNGCNAYHGQQPLSAIMLTTLLPGVPRQHRYDL